MLNKEWLENAIKKMVEYAAKGGLKSYAMTKEVVSANVAHTYFMEDEISKERFLIFRFKEKHMEVVGNGSYTEDSVGSMCLRKIDIHNTTLSLPMTEEMLEIKNVLSEDNVHTIEYTTVYGPTEPNIDENSNSVSLCCEKIEIPTVEDTEKIELYNYRFRQRLDGSYCSRSDFEETIKEQLNFFDISVIGDIHFSTTSTSADRYTRATTTHYAKFTSMVQISSDDDIVDRLEGYHIYMY